MMTPTITAFERSPDRGRGLARDMRVRWALEEVGQPYEVQLQSFEALKQPAHLARNPFGQIPTYEDGDLVLFTRHVGALAGDRGTEGVLDDADLVLHTLFDSQLRMLIELEAAKKRDVPQGGKPPEVTP